MLSTTPERSSKYIDAELSIEGWYRHHRSREAPESPRRVLRLAKKIFREDFGAFFEPDDLGYYVIGTLWRCFERFDAAKVSPDVPVEDGFVRFFRSCFVQELRDAMAEERRHRRFKSLLRYRDKKAGWCPASRKYETFFGWAWHLYDEAARRSKPEVREFVMRHVVGRETYGQIASALGVPERTLKRRYGKDRLAASLRAEIRAMVADLPAESLDRLIYTLYFVDGLDEDEVSRLLCSPLEAVVEIVRRLDGRKLPCLDRLPEKSPAEGLLWPFLENSEERVALNEFICGIATMYDSASILPGSSVSTSYIM